MDREGWQATVHRGHKESDTTERLILSLPWPRMSSFHLFPAEQNPLRYLKSSSYITLILHVCMFHFVIMVLLTLYHNNQYLLPFYLQNTLRLWTQFL